MAQNYFSIVTNIGRNKLALSAAGGAAVTITHFAIGDGNGAEVNPTAASTALVREVWRTPVESVVIDPLNPSAVLVTSIIPTAAGGWWMREFGIFDVDGHMVAVAKPVAQYKPTALEGQLEDIRYEFQIIIGETANVTMLVDPSVLLASRAWVESRKVPVAQLSLTPWVPVKSMTVTAPPASPAVWDAYVIPAGATGAWTGHAQKLAEWNGSSWNIITTKDGHGISLPDGRVFEKVGGVYIEKLALDVQSGKWTYVVAGGSANALTATLTPTPVALIAGMSIRIKISASNTGPATINVNALGAKSISRANGDPLKANDVVAGQVIDLSYDGDKFQVSNLNPALLPTRAGQIFDTPGIVNWTVPDGVMSVKVRIWAGGGGGGGGATSGAGGGGGGAGYAEGVFPVTPGTVIPITVGGGGGPGNSGGSNGGNGGTSSFGSFAAATGGGGGRGSSSGGVGGTGGSGSGGQFRVNGQGAANSYGPLSPKFGSGGAGAYGTPGSGMSESGGIGAGFPGGGGGAGANGYSGSGGGGGLVVIEF